MRFFTIATIAIAFVVASGENNSTSAVSPRLNSTVSSDNITSTFGDIDDSSSDDFSSDETITSINLNAREIGTFKVSSDAYSDSTEEQETHTHNAPETQLQKHSSRMLINRKINVSNAGSQSIHSYITLINSEGNDFASFAVNGLESEYYDPLLLVFEDSEKDSEEDYEAIVICAIEKLQLLKPPLSPSTAMRCLCNESGCNVPKPLEEFLKFNRNVIETNKNTDLSDHMPIPNDFSP
ncbi:hypothetical protein L3Y34_013014 [Caenorhabditis briggsae]|uniref:Uncharacterized protein n=1 Tax=Caenorhabditis briggsae TaxID=6238 RepID=A0AAE8ZVW7_CAEBR|nr:hypothetical protein L3Y34_013014 [Caenorhabditis briggsae]